MPLKDGHRPTRAPKKQRRRKRSEWSERDSSCVLNTKYRVLEIISNRCPQRLHPSTIIFARPDRLLRMRTHVPPKTCTISACAFYYHPRFLGYEANASRQLLTLGPHRFPRHSIQRSPARSFPYQFPSATFRTPIASKRSAFGRAYHERTLGTTPHHRSAYAPEEIR